MKKIAFRSFVALSIGLAIAVATCWSRSRHMADSVRVEIASGYGIFARSAGGALTVGIDLRPVRPGNARVDLQHDQGDVTAAIMNPIKEMGSSDVLFSAGRFAVIRQRHGSKADFENLLLTLEDHDGLVARLRSDLSALPDSSASLTERTSLMKSVADSRCMLASVVRRFRYSLWAVEIPCWTALLLVCVFPSCVVAFKMHRRLRSRPSVCLQCGYDLRATPGRCPECGREREERDGKGETEKGTVIFEGDGRGDGVRPEGL